MALLAQFIGEEAVAKMSLEQVDRACEFLHADMLKHSLGDHKLKAEIEQHMTRITKLLVK